jgi:glycosyltransferase involved in cell wall biosynthesis
MRTHQTIAFVVPSLKLSGGNLELLKLADEWRTAGHHVTLITMWRSPHSLSTDHVLTELSDWQTSRLSAAPQLPPIARRFWRVYGQLPPQTRFVFTHYASLGLAPFVARQRRWLFVQDLEWNFVSAGPLRTALRAFVEWNMRHCGLLSANSYLTAQLTDLGLRNIVDAPVWADPSFLGARASTPTFDVLVPIRKGAHKRPDLSYQLIASIERQAPDLRIAAITTEDGHDHLRSRQTEVFVRLDRQAMRDLYAESRTIVSVSEHEGFGLPPLEAMGSGCVPLVRDAGGPRVYMTGSLRELVIPKAMEIGVLAGRLIELLRDREALDRLSLEAREIFKTGLLEVRDVRASLAAAGLPDA